MLLKNSGNMAGLHLFRFVLLLVIPGENVASIGLWIKKLANLKTLLLVLSFVIISLNMLLKNLLLNLMKRSKDNGEYR